MTIVVNGSPLDVPTGTTVAALMLKVVGTTRGTAAAIGGVVVPRSQWNDHVITTGDVVELITAVQGG